MKGCAGRVSKTLVFALLVFLPGCNCGPPPDVILVTLDTTRVDHLGVYGYGRNITPEIDRFAEDAVVYRHAWSTASWTLPSHASMLTGKYPTSHGAHFNAKDGRTSLSKVFDGPFHDRIKVNILGEQEITLAEILRAAGYETAAFAGGPWLSPAFGLMQGYITRDAEMTRLAGRPADELTDRAIAWINKMPRERPLHLLINYFDPHLPYDPPPGYDNFPMAGTKQTVSFVRVNQGVALTPRERSVAVDRYDGEIRFMDHHVGRLLRALRSTDRYDQALIVIVADHGESFGEHGVMEHGHWLYEEVLRVPLLVHYPGGRDAGLEMDHPVSVVDLLPLIARETGLTLPDGVEGVPIGLRDLVLAESFRDGFANKLYGERFDRNLFAAIRWPWKLILSDARPDELYRLDHDPGELRSVAGKEMVRELYESVASARASLVPADIGRSPGSVSPETRENLRSLGYIE